LVCPNVPPPTAMPSCAAQFYDAVSQKVVTGLTAISTSPNYPAVAHEHFTTGIVWTGVIPAPAYESTDAVTSIILEGFGSPGPPTAPPLQ
jgi:hypothetical protein